MEIGSDALTEDIFINVQILHSNLYETVNKEQTLFDSARFQVNVHDKLNKILILLQFERKLLQTKLMYKGDIIENPTDITFANLFVKNDSSLTVLCPPS